jgi:hypothetical protein
LTGSSNETARSSKAMAGAQVGCVGIVGIVRIVEMVSILGKVLGLGRVINIC